MFEGITSFFKKIFKNESEAVENNNSKNAAKERLHLVLMQDRANVSADFLELMKQEIIDVIKKYIVVDDNAIDVRLTNQANDDGTTGAPALYANIPILNIRNDVKAEKIKEESDNKEIDIEEKKKKKTSKKVKEDLEDEEKEEIISEDKTEEEVSEEKAEELSGKESEDIDEEEIDTENEEIEVDTEEEK